MRGLSVILTVAMLPTMMIVGGSSADRRHRANIIALEAMPEARRRTEAEFGATFAPPTAPAWPARWN
jgi:hypothetical protein